MQIYSAKYSDHYGEFETTIRNDYKTLRMRVREVEFSGSSFDQFRPDDNESGEKLKNFTFNTENELSDFKLECEIPVKILENNSESNALLKVAFEYRATEKLPGIDNYSLWLILSYQGRELRSIDQGGFQYCFEEIRTQLRQLPNSPVLKCCFGCALSDYNMYGHALFGELTCFKNHKEKYLNMKTHYDYYDLLEERNLEPVQEIYLCSEYQVRKPATYYRG